MQWKRLNSWDKGPIYQCGDLILNERSEGCIKVYLLSNTNGDSLTDEPLITFKEVRDWLKANGYID